MPDWSYRTLFRPALFGLPSLMARDLTLGVMGGLSRLPGGTLLIRTLGHMESSPILESEHFGLNIKYPIGLSGGLDPHGTAHKALAQFGFGFIEVGPVTIEKVNSEQPVLLDLVNEAIMYPNEWVNEGLQSVINRMKKRQGHKLPYMFRLRHMHGRDPEEACSEQCLLMEKLASYASGFYLDAIDDNWSLEETILYIQNVLSISNSFIQPVPTLVYVPLDYPMDKFDQLIAHIDWNNCVGIVIGDVICTESGYVIGREGKMLSLAKLIRVREKLDKNLTVIVSGGIHEPYDAIEVMNAGASLLQLHSGLVYSGPGLPKRINEAIIYERLKSRETYTSPSFWRNWGWMCLLGLAMVFGGILAWLIAATDVVLPYDISFLGMDITMLNEVNDRLLPFMSHDRITLAGTMISIGIVYFQLARYALRQELHWAKTTLLTSGIIGFLSFFLYLGHGYFDPLHAAVAVILLPLFILSMLSRADEPYRKQPNLVNDRKWQLAQWGQLMFVVLGFALAIGGATISVVGITNVFVPQDLNYLQTTSHHLLSSNESLITLIAHDRAGFGGALLSEAIALLLTALWGIQQGERWLWWTFLIGGLPGFIAVFGVHLAIGYIDFIHLLPAVFALLLYIFGLILFYPYLMKRNSIVVKLTTQ